MKARFHDRRVFEGQWIEFVDFNGHGYAQPDIFVDLGEVILCVECKLTQSESALRQISDLYRPLLTKIYGRSVVGLVICSRLVYDPGVWGCTSIEQVLRVRQPNTYTMLWLGRL